MTTDRVNETVDNVSQALDAAQTDGDQVSALEKLQDDIRKDMQGMTPEQVKEYIPQLTKELEERNQLPVLALAFAEQLGGDLSESDLRSEVRAANRGLRGGDSTRELDKVLLNYLSENYDKGAELIETQNEAWFRDDANISTDDISAKLAEFRKQRDDQKQVVANQEIAGLVGGELLAGDDKSLFNFIDRNFSDGKLSKSELQKYISDAESSGSTNGQYAPEKQEVVKQILEDWDGSSGKWMRGEYEEDGYATNSLTKLGLARAAGEASQESLLAARNESEGAARSEANSNDEGEGDVEQVVSASDQSTDEAGSDVEQADSASDAQDEIDPNAGSETDAERAEEAPEPEIVYEVRRGDSYWRIASMVLGEGATPGEILEKTKELQELNDNQPLLWLPGNPQRIKIPPMKADTNRTSAQPRPSTATTISV